MNIVTLFFLVLTINASAQNSFLIKGVILDSLKNEPVKFVNVYMKNEGKIGSLSNDEGTFRLSLNKIDTIVFSALGYQTKYVIPAKKPIDTIFLLPEPFTIAEVQVATNKINSILQKAHDRLKHNHYFKASFYEAFVRVWQTTEDKLDLIEEYIIHLHQKLPMPKLKVIKGRTMPVSQNGEREFEQRQLYDIIGIWEDYTTPFLLDCLKAKNFDTYEYKMLNSVLVNNNLCYHISCIDKRNHDSIQLFIDKASYGIARIEQYLTSEKYSKEYAKNIDFVQINGKWQLKKSHVMFIAKGSSQRTERVCSYLKIDDEANKGYKSILQIG